jgi:hypothetical protein
VQAQSYRLDLVVPDGTLNGTVGDSERFSGSTKRGVSYISDSDRFHILAFDVPPPP